jgi:hypothetical protein
VLVHTVGRIRWIASTISSISSGTISTRLNLIPLFQRIWCQQAPSPNQYLVFDRNTNMMATEPTFASTATLVSATCPERTSSPITSADAVRASEQLGVEPIVVVVVVVVVVVIVVGALGGVLVVLLVEYWQCGCTTNAPYLALLGMPIGAVHRTKAARVRCNIIALQRTTTAVHETPNSAVCTKDKVKARVCVCV